MTKRDPARPLGAMSISLRVFAGLAMITGALDIIAGTHLLTNAGARLPETVAADPVLNSQIKFFGAIWFGYGVMLWWATQDLRQRSAVLHILMAVLFLGGIGRVIAAWRFGLATPLLAAFIAIELLGPIVVVAWRWRLRSHSPA